MTFSVLLQVFFNLVMLAAVAFLWVKMSRPQKDDPRLSRGLQLLQSKIAVLEDLSDQVESQVQQITALIEAKGREIQNQINASEKQMQKIEAAMGKSMEVAQIFQDRIPHQEIIERQNTIKYVKAARMAHQGSSLDEISEQVELSRGELELIIKVNKDQLQFSEEDLPEWAKAEQTTATASVSAQFNQSVANRTASVAEAATATESFELESKPLARAQDRAEVSLSSLGEKFRQVLPANEGVAPRVPAQGSVPAIEMPKKPAEKAQQQVQTAIPVNGNGKSTEVQKVVFPRLDMTQHLS